MALILTLGKYFLYGIVIFIFYKIELVTLTGFYITWAGFSLVELIKDKYEPWIKNFIYEWYNVEDFLEDLARLMVSGNISRGYIVVGKNYIRETFIINKKIVDEIEDTIMYSDENAVLENINDYFQPAEDDSYFNKINVENLENDINIKNIIYLHTNNNYKYSLDFHILGFGVDINLYLDNIENMWTYILSEFTTQEIYDVYFKPIVTGQKRLKKEIKRLKKIKKFKDMKYLGIISFLK